MEGGARKKPRVVCLGEVLIDFVAQETGVELGEARTFAKCPGGAVANVAVGLARLGLRSRMVSKVGNDPFGRFLVQTLAREGVEVNALRVSQDHPTGLVFVALDENRVPRFCFFGSPSADMMLDEEEVGPETLHEAAFFHLGTVSLVGEASRQASFKLLRLAAEQKVKVSFDPNFRLHLWKDHMALKRLTWEVIKSAALVKLNQEELEFLTGERGVEKGARRIMEEGVAAVVVTRGPAGAYYLCASGDGEENAFPVKVVDTTGAGDGFMAGLIFSLARRKWPPSRESLRKAVYFGNAVAAMVCAEVGAVAGLPRLAAVQAFLAHQNQK